MQENPPICASGFVLGGPCDLVTAYHWDHNPSDTWGNSYESFKGIISRVIKPVISSS